MKQGYEVEGTKVSTLADVAKLLGVARVSRKDLEGDGQYADRVTLCDLSDVADTSDKTDQAEDTVAPDNEDTSKAEQATEDTQELPSEESNVEESAAVEEPVDVLENNREVPEPTEEGTLAEKAVEEIPVSTEDTSGEMTIEQARETFPKFTELADLKDFIKDMDTPTLEYMLTSLGGTWDKHDNQAINRMRIAQGLHRVYFPKLFKPAVSKSKKKAKYGDFSTEVLKDMVKEHNLIVPLSGHDPIDRMRLVMTLKAGGYLPE